MSRYAPEFVSTKLKKIASFKRGLGPKLLKTMGRAKCATFNEFVSDALTQENYNTVYTATKTRKRAFEAGARASQSKALVEASPQYHAPTPNTRYRPPAKKNQAKMGSRKGYSIALPRGNTGPSYAKTPPANHPCWNCNQTGHWQSNCPYPPKKVNQGNVRQGHVHYTIVEAIPAGEVVTAGKFLVNQCDALVLFDSGALHSFVSLDFMSKHNLKAATLDKGSYCISDAGNNISTNQVVLGPTLEIGDRQFLADLLVLPGVGIDVILGMKWMSGNGVLIDTTTLMVMLRDPSTKEAFLVQLPRDIHICSTMNVVTSRAIEDIPVV